MKRFPLGLALAALVCLQTISSECAAPPSGSTLRDFFSSHGFGGAPLQRRFGNHLFVATGINGRRTALMIDTGSPLTLINRDSVVTLGLSVQKTTVRVERVFGLTYDTLGLSKLDSVAMGNCTLTNVPVAIADEASMNYYGGLPHLDGLFGAREMVKFGAVIDCARQMLYINPNGPGASISQQMAGFLAGRGFTRIPLRLSSNRHFDVEAAINGHSTRLIVDTGAGSTILSKRFAVQSGVAPAPIAIADAGDGRRERISGGYVNELTIGSFKIDRAEVEMGSVASDFDTGLLGEEYLSFNFAVIDLGGMALYLRHPDSR